MNLKIILTAIIGVLIAAISAYFIDMAAGSIILILAFTIVMVQAISADAAKNLHPEIFVSLSEDTQTIIIENLGTATAQSVEIKVIPDNHHFEIGDLGVDETRKVSLPKMVTEGKAAISWSGKEGARTEKIFRLSGYESASDPLRPVFPLFGWKGK